MNKKKIVLQLHRFVNNQKHLKILQKIKIKQTNNNYIIQMNKIRIQNIQKG